MPALTAQNSEPVQGGQVQGPVSNASILTRKKKKKPEEVEPQQQQQAASGPPPSSAAMLTRKPTGKHWSQIPGKK